MYFEIAVGEYNTVLDYIYQIIFFKFELYKNYEKIKSKLKKIFPYYQKK